ncbi:efflux RND transporter permease subunit [Pontiella agarivorans]|uniref:Efflux RND transporter permease subunit n=1 Tax=Pontiella agarivorans TaxID=3038953 RepID=A0ABU5MXS3_9BACT|nr:efflux RND transporter permease subunit [Pontiella agarivorans]MDZ8119020.1 efflux RND transporter permease subunit [Pontiella agarivorans]
MHTDPAQTVEQRSAVGRLIRFCLENRLIVALFTAAVIFGGLLTAPFDWKIGDLQRYPVAVDAIPDIGENQQIVFTEWMGRSPQDVEDQIGYPLMVQLLGIPGVKTIRSYSMFGFSSIYIIFKEDVEFYWSRTRVLEKLNSLPAGTLPDGVQPTLGPDATALGQVYWYTLEGLDPDGNPTGGWDPEELRTTQDWYARYWLLSADGVAEVASVGGFVREYQVDVDPDAMRAFGVSVDEVYQAVQGANLDVGAKNLEVNRVEYFIRGVGFIQSLEDIENSVIKVNADGVPVLIKHVADVTLGPAQRRGALDKGGAPAVGGVVVARYGDNPLRVIRNVKEKIAATAQSLPKKTLADGTVSQLTVIPFYDRTGLIYETLGTLNEAIVQQILITIIVVLIMVMHLRSGLAISTMLPLTVLLCFIGMKLFNVQANIVALSGIAIAIGTIVDMGIVICENIIRHLDRADPEEPRIDVVHRAASEVGGAVLTAVLTTVISFLPVFTMIGAEGKLFKPLAFTKTVALVASIILALTVLPVLAHTLFGRARSPGAAPKTGRRSIRGILKKYFPIIFTVLLVGCWLTIEWEPLGPQAGTLRNLVFVTLLIGGLLLFFRVFQHFYAPILRWCLNHKSAFLALPLALLILGTTSWLGFSKTFGWLPDFIEKTPPVQKVAHAFPGFGKEFMPTLDEGSFLWMPTTMTHASIGEALDILQKQDMAFESIPEIASAVGKLGRAETSLDPAPISMIETVINYKPEFRIDPNGKRLNFRYEDGEFVRDTQGQLIEDERGRPYRQWRDHIRSPDDIWDEIVKAGKIPGTTSAPRLQPIAARIVMLQSGMRAPMGVKVQGPDLETIERVGLEIERYLKEVPSVEPAAVIADRIVGKPYLEIVPDREALARYGIPIRKFQNIIEIAIGGKKVTGTVEGRERFPVRVRYQRELRDNIEALEQVLIPGMKGQQIPITQLAEINYVRGPQNIKSEDTFLVGYVVFDKKPGHAEVDVVEQAQAYLQRKIDSGEFSLPRGVSYRFAGSYENQLRASRTLSMVLPIALFAIFMLIYFQFKSAYTTFLIFTGVFIAWSGGFILIWLYGQLWFLDFSLFGTEMRDLFQVHVINMSVAVWVGFLALFGIATDDGVVMGTYLTQTFRENTPTTKDEVRALVLQAGNRRVRACLMTTATTILALLPVLTSTGRGSDIMVPMAIPSFGGMLIEIVTMLVVPVLYCWRQESEIGRDGTFSARGK